MIVLINSWYLDDCGTYGNWISYYFVIFCFCLGGRGEELSLCDLALFYDLRVVYQFW